MVDTAETLHSGRYLRLCERSGWEFATRVHPTVVVLIAWTEADELLLVEQYREPVRQRCLELPAGLVGDRPGEADEPEREAAARELEEETGYRAGRLELLMRCPTSAGMTDECAVFFRASGLERVSDGGGDASEDITVHRIPRAEVHDWLLDRVEAGAAVDPKIWFALYWSGLAQPSP
ncbi:NUDIX hydrolase [Wenzhouxiangella sp. XN79A]|uniref:NUDIX hydrolase n=1 Tax=Wenzhouxiangella sp. XN79A TaxID=2724193 RepID=UPI00144A6A60|nr:NUDIX hydrolase [Wenzhouxiangella sp. XN79A]NKI34954.1 NUDIX hydrolase [Wenzhouxiangella sp. XN79A]